MFCIALVNIFVSEGADVKNWVGTVRGCDGFTGRRYLHLAEHRIEPYMRARFSLGFEADSL